MSYFVEVKDWETQWAESFEGRNFKAKSGYVAAGPVTPLATDFSKLTPAQRNVMLMENIYWWSITRAQRDFQEAASRAT